ncbi:MAG: bifunctional 3-(3-hydroxy-phenyl)propionate/3-hydroxycinnamic acid hydroxylase [Acidimicrobiales bacterium]
METNETFDVAIVGYGPVGAALAILLGQQGHRVVVLERWAEPYPLPRAVHYDHEVARILQSCGVADQCAKIVEPAEVYEFQNAEGNVLVRFGRRGNGRSGWPQSTMFSQPELESVLFARVDELPSIEVRRGWEVTDLVEDGDHVVVRGGTGPIRARYVTGCDGANSTVRGLTGITREDRAFFYDWLVVDVVFDEPRVYDPLNVQICDPARPTTMVSGGPGRRRWEFMALPGETAEDLNEESTAWRLLERFDARPDNARLEKHAVYRFQARWAEEWRRGRVLLAGDAAHQTPPFAGQGLCSGLRDAANLAWKLDLVLRDLAPDALLDAYGRERGPNMRAVIELAIGMGELICVADPEEAAARDAAFIAADDGRLTDIPPFPPIGEGVVMAGSPCAGELFLQAEIDVDGRPTRFDDAVGAGWRLVTLADPGLDEDLARWFTSIGGAVVSLGCGPSPVEDVDGAYGSWFAARGLVAVLQRPDFAIYGTAAAVAEIADVVRSLRTALAGFA